ncbi:uncharacterized protein AMSG_10587 [Thecamonas trahens ATCC 50062]|uniref:ADF-H domain-containing protein n=1 Tax=Thecamonas trahens ATCC 50062 TaxID=461836 RepID=A0A0L0DRH2_THETB|nr:hypothetical protein AMSG_10587 [Thecamonas trahens ATCC 50062]KNC54924.1 hypothetical protein AMSG_10587 [Thecamonas trahens ATCC 50062]|eukprot:XP_013753512.1 hypothetical protein AMSG_10587 [Thecamonas trahens ATCC 50062]
MASTNTCDVGDDVVAAFKAFRKKNAEAGALILTIDGDERMVHVDEEIDEIDLEELAGDLPDSIPRFIVYSYKWQQTAERVSYPLVMIFYCPSQCNPYFAMMYTSSKHVVCNKLSLSKVFDLDDADDLNEEWL